MTGALAFWCVSLVQAPRTAAQESAPFFQRYGLDDGLSNPSAISLAEDHQGFLWIGTQGGLNRFDGHKFTVFTSQPADSASLSSSWVRSLLVTSGGQLWVGTERGLDLYLGNGRFARHRVVEEPSSNVIWSLAEAGNADLVLSTEGGAFIFDPMTGRSMSVPGDPVDEEGTPFASHTAAAMPDGRVVIGYMNGSLRLLAPPDDARGEWVELDRLLFDSPPRALHPIARDTTLVGTTSGKVLVVSVSPELTVEDSLIASREFAGSPVQAIHRDRAGHTWVATQNGLIQVHPDGKLQRHRPDPVDPTSLADLDVLSIIEDRSGVLWIATWRGLTALGARRHAIRRFPGTDRGRGALPPGGVVSITEAPDGGIWLGLFNGELSFVDRATGAIRSFRPDGSAPGTAGAVVVAVELDREGSVWSATLGAGLAMLSPATGALERFSPVAGELGRRAHDFVEIYQDHRGELWAGSIGFGLYRLDRRARDFFPYRGPDDAWDFGEPYIWPILEDSLGQLWFGSDGPNGGIHRLSTDRTEHWSLLFDASAERGLSEGRILTLYPHTDGFVWVGTEGGGLNRVDPKTKEVKVYRTADGLPDDHVNGIIADDDGYLWISTNGGLARFDTGQEEFWTFRVRDGLQDNRFFANSVFKGRGGELYFGGPGGLNVIEPSKTIKRGVPPPVSLTRFQVHYEDRPIGSWAEGEGRLVLQPGDNFFTFEFAALDLTDPSLNRYRYKLDGLDEDWIESADGRTANYTSVPPNRYTFLVSAANSEGVWNEEALRISITVQPRYYQTWWFRVVMGALAASLLMAAYGYRMWQIARVAAMRLQIAGELHNDIGANLSAIRLKSELVRKKRSGETREPALVEIERLARDTTQKVREMIWVVKEENDSLEGLLTRMEDAAATLLGGVTEFEFQVDEAIPDRPIPMALRQDIYSIYKEALQNTLKHAAASRVSIRASYTRPDLCVRIEDDGRGFDVAQIQRGHGLGLIEACSERRGVDVQVTSASGVGTRVELRVRVR